jgi:hypothetical protein
MDYPKHQHGNKLMIEIINVYFCCLTSLFVLSAILLVLIHININITNPNIDKPPAINAARFCEKLLLNIFNIINKYINFLF